LDVLGKVRLYGGILGRRSYWDFRFDAVVSRVLHQVNVATIIHSDEALLAVGFIFTIHFFNTHLRPEAFPMDTVIFTGLAPYKEYKKERPQAIEDLKASGELRKRVVIKTISKRRALAIRIFGSIALAGGIFIIGLIIYSVLFGYH
jgi:hypothetical protein